MIRIPKWNDLHSGDLALTIVVAAGFVLYFTNSAYQATITQTILMVVSGIVYLALSLWGSHQLEAWKGWQRAIFFAITIALGTTIGVSSNGAAWMILLPLVSEAVQYLKTTLAVLVTILIWIGTVLPVGLSGNLESTMSAAMGYLSAVVFVAVFTQITVNEQRMRRELASANNRLREYTHQLEEKTVLTERNRLAREIHDGLGHYLTSIHIQLKAAQAVLKENPDVAQEAMNKAEYLAQEALNDVRRSVTALRADQPSLGNVSEAIRELIPTDSDGPTYTFEVTGKERELPPSISWMLYRAAQETLTNIRKHAEASRVDIRLNYDDRQVNLTVTDDGRGADSLDGGFGISGLRERVQILGGTMDVVTTPGKGFSVQISAPYPIE